MAEEAYRSSLPTLTNSLNENIQLLDTYYGKRRSSVPSFEPQRSNDLPQEKPPLEVMVAQDAAMDNAAEILDLLSGPTKVLSNLTVAYQTLACLRWLCHFNVLKSVPLTGDITYEDLAKKAGVSISALKSIARMAMTARLLQEKEPGKVSHSAASYLLATKQPFHDWALFVGKEAVSIAMNMVEAHEKWPGSEKPNETPFNIALQTKSSFFEHLKQRPDHMKIYAEYQKAVASTEGLDLKHLVRAFDWATLGEATIVDVGGSIGMASVRLAKEFPSLRFIVQELPPDVLEDGKAYASSTDNRSVASRIQYQAHDFFEEQPVKGAPVYLLRMILHYWSFDESLQILRSLISSMVPGTSRIFVMDTVLPGQGQVTTVTERQLRVRDLAMMQLHSSHERSPEDWEAMFKAADPRLQLTNVVVPFGSELALMIVEFNE